MKKKFMLAALAALIFASSQGVMADDEDVKLVLPTMRLGGHANVIVGAERAEIARHATEPFQNKTSEDAPYPMMGKLNYNNMGSHEITWGLRGAGAGTIIHVNRAAFEVGFRGMPGVDEALYTAALVRLAPYQTIGRTGGMTTLTYTATGPKLHFKDTIVPANVKLPIPGEAKIFPLHPLEPGEYAIVLRPLNEASITAGSKGYDAMVAGSAGGTVQPWQYAWDFSVRY